MDLRKFTARDFEIVFLPHQDPERRKLTKQIFRHWNDNWKKYLNQKNVPNKNKEYDHHGTENKKFLHWILKKDSAYKTEELIVIFLTSRMRQTLKKYIKKTNAKCHGLRWILAEWDDQTEDLKHFDSLTQSLIFREYHQLHIAWAISSHARRMRIGANRPRPRIKPNTSKKKQKVSRNKNTEEKISLSARLLNLGELQLCQVKDECKLQQFCSMPPSKEVFKVYFHGQKMLNTSRTGSQKEAAILAKKQRELIDHAEKNATSTTTFDWSNFLLWYTYYVEIRAASASLNEEKLKEIKVSMKELEKNTKGRLQKYFRINLSDRMELKLQKNDDVDSNSPLSFFLYEMMMNRWKNFELFVRENEKDLYSRESVEYQDFGGINPEKLGFPELHEMLLGPKVRGSKRSRVEGTALQHPFAPFQKFVVGARNKPNYSAERANTMLVEINKVRAFEPLFESDLSCVVMEMLFRELLYRLWYEVGKISDRRIDNENNPWFVDTPLAIKVLKNIKDDIIRLRAFENDEHPAIDATIKLLKHPPSRGMNLAKKLREHLDDERYFNTYHEHGKQCYFLGIPYANENDNWSEILHPFPHILGPSDSEEDPIQSEVNQ